MKKILVSIRGSEGIETVKRFTIEDNADEAERGKVIGEIVRYIDEKLR